jgi:hypothetical protein
MPDERRRLESQLRDIERALVEARSADVRALLRDLLHGCRQSLSGLEASTRGGDTAAAGAAPPPPKR